MPQANLEVSSAQVAQAEQAEALQQKQFAAREAMYDAWNDAVARFEYKDYDAAAKDPEHLKAKAAYEATVAELEALLGPNAHCNAVDCDLWSLFSDCYKDDAGFRPRFHQTRAEVQAYLAQPRTFAFEDSTEPLDA